MAGKNGAPPVMALAAMAPIMTVRMKSKAVALLRKRFLALLTMMINRMYMSAARAAMWP